ncbi:MAG: proline--tRNA ligase [Planctomycetes bacterium]|nr:proline--tRNA ligase [Planctomycetota bacterium]
MRWTRCLIPTLRQTPAEAVVPSHQLMLRAGLIQQVAAGSYSYLPLGWRALHKAIEIVRQEMNRAGAVEVFLPTLQPIELWEKTGRRAAYGDNLFVVEDRHGREQALGPTHEEVITDLVRRTITSYRDLPLNLYQIQTKFRDEFRPRFGVMRSREFQMKDAYSFHLSLESLGETYEAMRDAYRRIFTRCGVAFVEVEAEAGPIGGNASHEFMVPSPTGEDTILASDKGNYAANMEKCETGPRQSDLAAAPTGELEKLHTPGCPGIEDVCAFFKKNLGTKLKTQNMLKTLVCKGDGRWIVAVVRGDHDLNEAKVKAACGLAALQLADEREARDAGFAIGFVGPHVAVGRHDITLVVDPDAAQGGFWVTGANETDHHVKHFNWQREVVAAGVEVKVADIRNAMHGDPSPKNDGGVLQASQGIEVGHVFKLGCKYSEALGLTVLDENQQTRSVIMGCYGIGVNRILAAALESEAGHDEGGIIWPMAIAPYQVILTPVRYEGQTKDVVDALYEKLTAAGIDVLLDDRDERPGVKFKDADLIGIPLRLTIGDKGLAAPGGAEIEFKPRTAEKPEMIKVDDAADKAIAFVRAAMENGK